MTPGTARPVRRSSPPVHKLAWILFVVRATTAATIVYPSVDAGATNNTNGSKSEASEASFTTTTELSPTTKDASVGVVIVTTPKPTTTTSATPTTNSTNRSPPEVPEDGDKSTTHVPSTTKDSGINADLVNETKPTVTTPATTTTYSKNGSQPNTPEISYKTTTMLHSTTKDAGDGDAPVTKTMSTTTTPAIPTANSTNGIKTEPPNDDDKTTETPSTTEHTRINATLATETTPATTIPVISTTTSAHGNQSETPNGVGKTTTETPSSTKHTGVSATLVTQTTPTTTTPVTSTTTSTNGNQSETPNNGVTTTTEAPSSTKHPDVYVTLTTETTLTTTTPVTSTTTSTNGNQSEPPNKGVTTTTEAPSTTKPTGVYVTLTTENVPTKTTPVTSTTPSTNGNQSEHPYEGGKTTIQAPSTTKHTGVNVTPVTETAPTTTTPAMSTTIPTNGSQPEAPDHGKKTTTEIPSTTTQDTGVIVDVVLVTEPTPTTTTAPITTPTTPPPTDLPAILEGAVLVPEGSGASHHGGLVIEVVDIVKANGSAGPLGIDTHVNLNQAANAAESEESTGLKKQFTNEYMAPYVVKRCGIPHERMRRIVGGTVTPLDRYPWTVGLWTRFGKRPYCGGVIVSWSFVLTAAHCTRSKTAKDLRVSFGLSEMYYDRVVNEQKDHLIPVEAIHQNPLFKDIVHGDDISILKMSAPLQQDGYPVTPICIPEATSVSISTNDIVGTEGVVVGWGRTTYGGDVSKQLREVSLPIVTNTECQKVFKDILKIREEMICAGDINGTKDACQGDSGGALMWRSKVDDRWYALGVVSFGVKCAEPGYYGTYTRVQSYLEWLCNVTEGLLCFGSSANRTSVAHLPSHGSNIPKPKSLDAQ